MQIYSNVFHTSTVCVLLILFPGGMIALIQYMGYIAHALWIANAPRSDILVFHVVHNPQLKTHTTNHLLHVTN